MSVCRIMTIAAILGIASSAAAASKPNILVILADDGGFNMQGFNAQLHGQTTPFLTPNLDALAAQSMIARQGYTANSVCGPSRVGLLTGMYPQRLGLEHNIGQDETQPWGYAANQQLISTRLKDLGYTTGMVGKWHGGYAEGTQPNDKGFDEYFGFLSGSRSYWGDAQPYNAMMRNKTNVEGVWRSQGDHSQYDPAAGRYATDAYAEEAEDFINRHAHDEQPFFMYASFTAPHDPQHAKSSDLALFSGISDASTRTLAAMNYALDRGVGRILGALDSQGIRDNTLVVYMNDNGGVYQAHNVPLNGVKGMFFEGGTRTAITLSGPGITPGVYDQPISAYDILPTAVAMGGGTTDPGQMAGVDLMPYLTGQQAGAPHQVMHWRYETTWAIRKDNWKLEKPYVNAPLVLADLSADPNDYVNVINTETAKRDELLRELTYWEATLEKPIYGFNGIQVRNHFDHFVFRPDMNLSIWHGANTWYQAGTTTAASMLPDDGYANAIMEFPTLNTANYTGNNAFQRLSGQTFMINELRMTGVANSSTFHSAALNGNPLLFVKSLTGNSPKIRCDATNGQGAGGYLFTLTEQVQMLDDLEITGNGNVVFAFNNVFKDFYEPRSLTKSGTSNVTFNALSTYKGATILEQGEIKFASSISGLDGTSSVTIKNGARIRQERGLINTQLVDIRPGGLYQLYGGRLQTDAVVGNLTNLGATFAGSTNPGPIVMTGNYSQNQFSKMELRLGRLNGANVYDGLVSNGSVQLAGSLILKLADLGSGLFEPSGLDTFQLISAANVYGTFSSVTFPEIDNPNLEWNLVYEPTAVTLRVVLNAPDIFTPENGIDSLDLFVIKAHFGMENATLADGDANGDTVIDGFDLIYWQQLYGPPPSTANISAVPEGSTSDLFVTAAACVATSLRVRGKRRETFDLARDAVTTRTFAPQTLAIAQDCGSSRSDAALQAVAPSRHVNGA